jgi:hypothetical protein
MVRGTCAGLLGLFLVLGALPAGAQAYGELRVSARPGQEVPVPLELPDGGAFEELLLSFSDVHRGLQGGFQVQPLSLAIRSRARGFLAPGPREEAEAQGVLSIPVQEMTWSDLPGGPELATHLYGKPDVENLRVRDFGTWLRGPEGPLEKAVGEVLRSFPGGKPAAVVSGSVAALGLIYQYGTAPAHALGIEPVVRASLFGRRLRTSLRLDSGPRFENARVDLASHFALPEQLQLPLLGGRIELVEAGVTAQRIRDEIVVDTRWARVRARLAWLELVGGVRANVYEPHLWMDMEGRLRIERLSLRALGATQPSTGRWYGTATAMLHMSSFLSGVFLSMHGPLQHTMGFVTMAMF